MNNKKRFLRLSFLIALLVFMGFGQSAWSATWYSQGAVTLNNVANWESLADGSGSALGAWVTTDKYVVQGTHVLTFAAATFDTLFIQSTGAHVTAAVTVVGDVSVEASCSPTAGGALVINGGLQVTNNAAFTPLGALTYNDLLISDATMVIPAAITHDIKGDLALTGTSALTAAAATSVVTMTGTATQTITVSADSYCEFGDLTINNTGGVETSSNFTMRDVLTTTAGAFTATTPSIITFNPLAISVLWAATSAITFYDVVCNLGFACNPATNATITGDFTKIGGSDFAPTAGTITFTNTNLAGKTIQLVGGTNSFVNLAISAGSKITTSSDFTIGDPSTVATNGSLTIAASASLLCEAGTVTIVSDATTITNNGTLEFSNLTNDVSATVGTTTASSFTIKGDFTNAALGLFSATAGTITFDNTTQKTISNANGVATECVFWGVTIAEGSDITSATTITIEGDLTLAAASELTVTGGAGTETHFEPSAATQTITVADDANLSFSDVIIGATTAGTVTTADNFTVIGTAFTLTTAGADFFDATAGTITFTDACVLTAGTDGDLKFNNVIIDGAAVTDFAGDFVQFRGNLTLTNTGAKYTSGNGSTVTFIGTTSSAIGGDTDQDPAATFDVLVINKTGATGSDEVNLGVNVTIANTATSTITLTDGVLNLGSSTLTVGANVLLTQGTGSINGATGTYVISTGHNATGLTDAFFTLDGTPTLYNLTVLVAHTMGAGNLTVTNDFEFTGVVDFTIPATRTLEIKGDLITTAAGTFEAGAVATSKLKLTGTGACDDFSNSIFGAAFPSLVIERAETLTGALTMQAGNVFTINTSTQYLDLSTFTLTLNNTTVLNRVSGGIDASVGAVVFGTHSSQTTIPANLFKDNTVNNMTIVANTTLASDLTVDGTLTGVYNITTNNNILTFGASATLPAFTDVACVIGNLRRTVSSAATKYFVGTGAATGYRPITLQFATAGSTQIVKVATQNINPTLGRGGDPLRAVNVVWTITPEGTAPADSLKAIFGWDAADDATLTTAPADETTFAAKWNTSSWTSYRYNAKTGSFSTPGTPDEDNRLIMLAAGEYPISASALSGDWAVFVAEANTNTAKDTIIATTKSKLAITNINPSPVGAGLPFSVTVEYQNQYGNPQTVTDAALQVAFTDIVGAGTFPVGTIPVGSSSVVINGFSYASASAANQFKVAKSAGGPTGVTILAGVSPLLNIYGSLPSNQINTITLGGGTTSTTVDFTLTSDYGILLAKAGSAFTSADFPVDGTTYYASANYGEGSTIGDAVVVYKGQDPASAFTVSGLAPNTTYYFRGFSYGTATTPGTEKYLTFAAANNPKSFTTTGGVDDDTEYGTNNTMATAKPIGTNTPLKGTIKTTTDVDWFSFSVTNSSPNLRAQLTLSASLGNYNIEVYDINGNLIRRGTRLSNNTENQVVNELISGTYLVKISGVDGASDTTNYYTLQLTTKGEEIYSVTP